MSPTATKRTDRITATSGEISEDDAAGVAARLPRESTGELYALTAEALVTEVATLARRLSA